MLAVYFFFFQAEDGIRDRSPSRGLGDVYKRQSKYLLKNIRKVLFISAIWSIMPAMENLVHIMIFLYRNHLI